MSKTRIALLGTVSDLHEQPIGYDLGELGRILASVQPDLLGIEIERDEFERGDLQGAPIEVREALIPAARKIDTVLVPIGAASPDELHAPQAGVRSTAVRALDTILRAVQSTANNARRINSSIVSHTCGLICHLEEEVCGKRGRMAWTLTNEKMLANICEMARRDPGTRILVAVQCRRKHWLEPKLKKMSEVELVNYWEL